MACGADVRMCCCRVESDFTRTLHLRRPQGWDRIYLYYMCDRSGVGLRHVHAKTNLTAETLQPTETRDGAGQTSMNSNRSCLQAQTCSKTPGGAAEQTRDRHTTSKPTAHPPTHYRFIDIGGSRDTHETDTRTSQCHKPTSNPTPPTDSRARPHPNPGTHASPHTTPLTRSSAVVVTVIWRRRPDVL